MPVQLMEGRLVHKEKYYANVAKKCKSEVQENQDKSCVCFGVFLLHALLYIYVYQCD